ncbi:MAG: helix-turn-helix domain-containing protein [Pirellula sp.]
MSLLSSSFSYLTLQQPRMRKGSFASLVGSTPLLDVFVAGPENQWCLECLSPFGVEQLPRRSPLFLYGPSGSGKTALALTLAARWINDSGDRTITVTSGSDFAKALTRAIEADDMERFRQMHRECNCLVVDNIHELATKPIAQEEMIATIERLAVDGLAVIATAPELAPLTPNLRLALSSRLNGGLSVPVAYPSFSTRIELLRLLAKQLQLDIAETDLDAMGEQLQDGVSALQLRGILIRWSHHDRMNPVRSQRESKRLIDKLVDSQTAKSPDLTAIAKVVGREMQITLEVLRGPGRKSSVVRARGLAMYLMRKLTDESYQNIGAYFGGRDHTTVMHACKKTEEDLHSDSELMRTVDRVRQRLVT